MDQSTCTPDAVKVSIVSPPAYAPPPLAPPYENIVASKETVVTQQPIAGFRNDWMTVPTGAPECPQGLEYLSTLDKLLVKQKVSLTEALIGIEANNKYIIKNSFGQNVYMVIENANWCFRNCCGHYRPFKMKVLDLFNNEIIHFDRPLACTGCWCPCCLQSIKVSAPPGEVIGHIDEEWTCWFPNYKIKNQNGDTVLRIEGPCVMWSCCSDINFTIVDMNGTEIGKIAKKWSGLAREYFTDADFFGIDFPMDLDVKLKATLIGACMLIDMMYFENNEGKKPKIPNVNINI